jgi:hypothetical protein
MWSSLIYQSKVTGEYLQLLKKRESNVNTYLQVDINGVPIIKKRSWTNHPDEQRRIIKGFKNLIRCKDNQ